MLHARPPRSAAKLRQHTLGPRKRHGHHLPGDGPGAAARDFCASNRTKGFIRDIPGSWPSTRREPEMPPTPQPQSRLCHRAPGRLPHGLGCQAAAGPSLLVQVTQHHPLAASPPRGTRLRVSPSKHCNSFRAEKPPDASSDVPCRATKRQPSVQQQRPLRVTGGQGQPEGASRALEPSHRSGESPTGLADQNNARGLWDTQKCSLRRRFQGL